jgi:hypothetical protein
MLWNILNLYRKYFYWKRNGILYILKNVFKNIHVVNLHYLSFFLITKQRRILFYSFEKLIVL